MGRSRATTPSSRRPSGPGARSGPWACATPSPSPSSPAPGACSSTTSARARSRRSTTAWPAPTTAGPSPRGPSRTPTTRAPCFSYAHGAGGTRGCAITGGTFYNPAVPQFPAAYVGKYFFSDLCNGWIRRLDPATGTASPFATGISNPVDLKVGPDGLLYYLARGTASVWKVQFGDGTPNAPPTATISEPHQRTLYNAGDTIEYAGSASDPEDGLLAAQRADLAGGLPPRRGHGRLRAAHHRQRDRLLHHSRHRRDVRQRLLPDPADRARLRRPGPHDLRRRRPAPVHVDPGHRPARPADHAGRRGDHDAGHRGERGSACGCARARTRLAPVQRRHVLRVRVLVGRRRGHPHHRHAVLGHDVHGDLRRPADARGRGPGRLLLRQHRLHGHVPDAPRSHRGLHLARRAHHRHRARHLQRALDGPGARQGHAGRTRSTRRPTAA